MSTYELDSTNETLRRMPHGVKHKLHEATGGEDIDQLSDVFIDYLSTRGIIKPAERKTKWAFTKRGANIRIALAKKFKGMD